jgi:hypothetical protein
MEAHTLMSHGESKLLRKLVATGVDMPPALKKILGELGITRASAVKMPSGGCSLSHDLGISPGEFLSQAENDFESGGGSARFNAISNAKRAIFSQLDQALFCLGFKPTRMHTRKKIKLFVDLGFVAPRILKKVIEARNLLEHEYRTPTKTRVADAIDLAALFVEATSRSLAFFEASFNIGNADEQIDGMNCRNELQISFDEDAKVFELWATRNYSPIEYRGEVICSVKILPGDPLFTCLARLAFAGDNSRKIKPALAQFFDALESR